VQEKLDLSKEKYKRAALLMTEFLHDTLSRKQNILTQGGTKKLFTMQSIEEMSREEKVELVRLLKVVFKRLF